MSMSVGELCGFMAPFLFRMTYSCDEGFDIHPAGRCTTALQAYE
jgi:hypothetical protein